MARDGAYVLVVEDDADIIEALDLFFAEERIRWRASAGEVDPRDPPSLALMDLSLAAAEEGRVAARLRALDVPIVVVSGAAHARDAAREMGAAACLQKPFELPALLAVIHGLAPQAIEPRSLPPAAPHGLGCATG